MKYVNVKYFLDIIIAYLLLVLCYIPMILIAIAIKLTDRGPVIFKQNVSVSTEKFLYAINSELCAVTRQVK